MISVREAKRLEKLGNYDYRRSDNTVYSLEKDRMGGEYYLFYSHVRTNY